ncbi:MAG: anthranilate synthase component I family protein [Alcanivorax sp.]|nr:anthranilate synthase component I family protein [Alcanivorax sp.]|tara:strand:- start:39 stop:1136 length:1098 start_codon:yes stop_codon:yes gene_type:complete
MLDSVHVVFHQNGRLLALGPPDHTLYAQDRETLEALPERVAEALAQGYRFACGLLPYTAGLALHGIGHCDQPAVVHLYRSTPRPFHQQPGEFHLTRPFRAQQTADKYAYALQRISCYLVAGDCYQVNYSQRFDARFEGDPLIAFQRLVHAHPAPHACFFRDRGEAVFGVSPERFLRVDGREVVTEPIKGSRPRGNNEEEDRRLGEALLANPKDRAENLMIVDLLRNDLGAVCEPGSITVDPLFELRRFSNVQHLVSTVHGRLRADVTPLAALISAFPGGSITGAPKKRAMEIIQELEPVPRGPYCGTLFWQDDQGRLDSNILIRTLYTRGNALYCHGGGGIVMDSTTEEEYRESRFKVEKLMAVL